MEESKKFTELSNESLEQVSGGWDPDSPGKPSIRSDCLGCYTCVDTCPKRAIVEDGKKFRIDHDICDGCRRCVPECPIGAIE